MLLAWSPALSRAGVVELEHVSTYRKRARVRRSGKRSGHAGALAFDLAAVRFADGRRINVLDDWKNKRRGADPCKPRGEARHVERLRGLACKAADEGMFQVVLTPHFDRAHRNHLHLEVKPGVDWTYVR